MRITLMCGSRRGLGTYVRAKELSYWLARFGHDVTLFCSGRKSFSAEQVVVDGVKEIGLPCFLNRLDLDEMASPLAKRWVDAYFRDNQCDIFHGFEHYAVVRYAAKAAVSRWGALYVSDWADWFSSAEDRRLFALPGYRNYMSRREEAAKLDAGGVTAISRCLVQRSLNLGIPEEKILYLPGGAPADRILPMPIESCRSKVDLDSKAFVFGYLGSFLVEELIPYLQATADLSRTHRVRFLIIGAESAAIRVFVERHRLQDVISMAGYVENDRLGTYLGACNVLVIPMKNNRYNECRWPNKIGDYLAAGRPVLSDCVGEMKAVLASAPIGRLVAGGVDEVRKGMLAFLNASEHDSNEMGKCSRRLAESEYSWERLTRRLEGFYTGLMHH